MKTIIISLILFVAGALYMGDTAVSFNPLTFKINRPVFMTGFIFLTIGFALMFYSKFSQGRKQGHQDAIEAIEAQQSAAGPGKPSLPQLPGVPWKKVIYGCESRGDQNDPYLTRYTLLDTGRWQLCLHVFHRSDWTDDMHDHPWNFLSVILWGGYEEHYKDKKPRRFYPGAILWRPAEHVHRVQLLPHYLASRELKRIEAYHHEEIKWLPRRKAVTLVWMGKRRRDWGFWAKESGEVPGKPLESCWPIWRFTPFLDYFRKNKC